MKFSRLLISCAPIAVCGLLLVLATESRGADLVVPNALASAQGDTGNLFPLLSPQPLRYQQVYDHAQFAGFAAGGEYITQISFRVHSPGVAFMASIGNIQINLSTTSKAPDALSPTFAANVGPDDTVAYPAAALQISSAVAAPADGPQAFDLVVTLATPFLYDPAKGNLLLDIRNISGASQTPSNDQQIDTTSTAADPVSRVYNLGDVTAPAAGQTGGTPEIDTFGAVTHFISTPVSPRANPPHILLNSSTRMRVETGDNVLIGGFIIQGSPKNVIIRAIGPSLAAAGVPGVLANPTLELHGGAGELIFSNDDWMNSPQKQEIIDSTLQPKSDLESAIVATLNPGNYTAIVRGSGNGAGVGLVEVYDLARTSTARLANLSTRGRVETGDNVMIGGFIIGGDQSTRVLVRAVGPSLATANPPVPDALANPMLELRDAQGALVDSNDDWMTSPQKQQIMDSNLAPLNPMESAVLPTLPPGNYTAIVRGVNNSVGVGLVELYNID